VIVVDSCGWVERFAGTSYGESYGEAFLDAAGLLVPTVCLTEVWRTLAREVGETPAHSAVAVMCQSRVGELGADLAVAAGRLGREHRLPLADSIIYATARRYGAELWTHDAHFRGLPGVRFVEPPPRTA
jgi:predicted nucleic acid-binding protein